MRWARKPITMTMINGANSTTQRRMPPPKKIDCATPVAASA
jgi:hypothetical protein